MIAGNGNDKGGNGVNLVVVAALLFAVFAVIHIACGNFPRKIDVLPDELRYLDTARSLFSGNGLVMRGEPSTFQKILYPLSLFPALLFPDGEGQVRAMNVLNSLYACSAVFPALLIARRLFDNPAPIVASMVFTLLLPDLMYSMTFMTEVLFLPLALWLVYLCWRCLESDGQVQKGLAIGAGVLCYVTYLCKEIAWMFLIAFAVWHVMALRRKRCDAQHCVTVVGLFCVGFFVPFLVMKLTLFAGMYNSYSQFSFDILFSSYTALFGLYSLVTDAVYFIVGFGVFPVIYLACTASELPQDKRDLLQFCLASLVVGLLAVVFTISMREDVGHVALRQHLRYVAPLMIPLLMLFMSQVAHLDPRRLVVGSARRDVLIGVTVGFCALVAGFFGSANLQQGFDNNQFHFLRWLLERSGDLPQEYFVGAAWTMSGIDVSDGALLAIDPLDWASRAAIIVFTAVGTWLLMRDSEHVRLRCGAVICALIAACMAANSVCAYFYNVNAYQATEDEVAEILAVNDQLAARTEHGGGEVVVLLDEGNTHSNDLIDTYLQDGAGDYRYYKIDDFKSAVDAWKGGNGSDSGAPDGTLDGLALLLTDERKDVSFAERYFALTQVGGEGRPGSDDGEDGRFILYKVGKRAQPDGF